jgi:hypothetical protein
MYFPVLGPAPCFGFPFPPAPGFGFPFCFKSGFPFLELGIPVLAILKFLQCSSVFFFPFNFWLTLGFFIPC